MIQTLIKAKRYLVDSDYRFIINAYKGKYNYMSDEEYIKRFYKARTGKVLDLDNPKSFSEKLQWLKLFDRKPEYTKMVDKFEAKEFVKGILGQQYIVPTYGVWKSFELIDFKSLPKQFVLKCTHDSGGLTIVRDKDNLDYGSAKEKIERSLGRSYYYIGREWPYKDVEPRIIAEKYLSDGHQGLRDYKFFTFDGEPKFIYISEGLENHPTAKISFFDLEGRKLPFKRSDYSSFNEDIQLPKNFDVMIELSKKLSHRIGCPFVRTDFYNIDGVVYFSEITFSPCNGMIPLSPPEWDRKLGDYISLEGRKQQ